MKEKVTLEVCRLIREDITAKTFALQQLAQGHYTVAEMKKIIKDYELKGK